MCGIAGFILENTSLSPEELLHSMTRAIMHRGPDDSGIFSTRTAQGNYHVGLGHRRLSIIDLGGGHQPMAMDDGKIQIVFNGEIYNFKILRDQLIARGHSFSTSSDTEVILHAYKEYGDDCVQHLRGMFAFAIWDGNRQRLLLARDRFGKKPLYFFNRNGTLLFASEIKALLKYPGLDWEVDTSAIWQYLAYRYVPAPTTLFSGIQKVMPGTIISWEKGKLSSRQYYLPPDRTPLLSAYSGNNPASDFLDVLEEAVQIRMVSDVPFGAFLSGGIDSSAIVGLMTRHSDQPVSTFSVGFREQTYSELKHARVIADNFGTNHHELLVSEDNLIEELPGLIAFRDAPVAEPSDIPIYLLSVEARKEVKMVLTGEGSDEIIGGYPKHVFERYVGMYQWLPGILRHRVLEPLIHAMPYRFRRAKTAIVNLGLENDHDRLPRWFGALSFEERSRLVQFKPAQENNPEGNQFNYDDNNSRLRNILYFDQTSWLPDNLLERGDRMTMAASLEARMPFMDHELAAFVSSLPDRFRIRGRTTKWVLREAMKQLLPQQILERPKVGFRVPVNEWFRGPMRDYLLDHLTSADSQTRCYYKRDALQKLLDEHIQGRQNHEKLLWGLLNLELWHRQYASSS